MSIKIWPSCISLAHSILSLRNCMFLYRLSQPSPETACWNKVGNNNVITHMVIKVERSCTGVIYSLFLAIVEREVFIICYSRV